MRKQGVVVVCAAIMLLPGVVFSQPREVSPREVPPRDMEQRMRREQQEMEQRMRREEQRFLNELKKQDPAAYKEYLAREKARQKKEKIRDDYRQGKITVKQARARLRPLIEEEIDVSRRVQGIGAEIKMLEQEIKRLKKIKKNPRLLIEEALDRELGLPSSPVGPEIISGRERYAS
ncbi:MAG: hypothetical protein ACE5GG_05605 [Candidatus Omnitrophota bacterium]